MSRPKYFIKTEVNVATGRNKWAVVKGFATADSIGMADSKEAATRLCEEFERLTDEIDRLRSQFANSEWQPIETAPKDGTKVLLFSGYITTAGWYSHESFEGNETVWECGTSLVYGPTHWMPLPQSPVI